MTSPVPPEKTKKKLPRALSALLKVAVPLVVSVGLCWVMFRDVDFHRMMQIIRTDCDFRFIGLTLFLSLFSYLFRALRWRIQLKAVSVDAPLFPVLLSIFGTYAVNLVFPRLGEVWRTGYIAWRQDAKFSVVFGSMLADRLADTLSVLLITAFTFVVAQSTIVDFVQAYPKVYSLIGAVITSPWTYIGGAAMLALDWWWLVRSRSALAAKVREVAAGLWEGFSGVAHMRGTGWWLLLTVALWGCYFLQLYVAFFSFPLTRQLLTADGATVVLVAFVLTSIAMGVPSNGGIGPYQTVMIFALGLFMPLAVSQSPELRADYLTTTAAFGNVIIATQTLTIILLGLFTFITIALQRRMPARTR